MKTIFFDIDGTLARFHDKEHNYIEKMWQEGFYKYLEPFENIVKAVNYIAVNIKGINVAVISAYLDTEPPFVQKEKREWLNEYLPEVKDIRLVPAGVDKSKYISLNDGECWLVDDYNKNLNEWKKAGYNAIKFVNDINDQGKGAYGGEKGELWQGERINYKTSVGNLVKKITNLMGVEYILSAQEIDNEINKIKSVRNEKFILSDECKTLSDGTEVFRVVAIKDFADVSIGDAGGFVENESNLMSIGNCWVYDEAVVCGTALVADNSVVKDNAMICGDAFISGNAEIKGKAVVKGKALVNGSAIIADNAVVDGYSTISDYAVVRDNVQCLECSNVFGYAHINNDTILKGRVNIGGSVKVKSGIYEAPILYSGNKVLGESISVLDKLNKAKNNISDGAKNNDHERGML